MTPSNTLFVEHFTQAARVAEARGFPALPRKPVEEHRVIVPQRPCSAEVMPNEDDTWPLAGLMLIAAEAANVSRREILSEGRSPRISLARHVFCWLSRHFTRQSTTRIGREMGGKDHSTVLHGVRKMQGIADALPEMPANDPRAWAAALVEHGAAVSPQTSHLAPDQTCAARVKPEEQNVPITGTKVLISVECPP